MQDSCSFFRSRIATLVELDLNPNRFLITTSYLPLIRLLIVFFLLGNGATSRLCVAVVNTEVNPTLSKSFLESIPRETIIQKKMANLSEALVSVESSEMWGVVKIGSNFSSVLRNRFSSEIGSASDSTGESAMDIQIDMSNERIGLSLQESIVGSFSVSALPPIIHSGCVSLRASFRGSA